MTGRSRPVAILVTTSLVAVLLAIAALDTPEGLRATYFSDVNGSSSPVYSTIDPSPSTERLFYAWRGRPPQTFSATWTGGLMVLREATYTFSATSDDGAWLYVDGELVADNGGRHPVRTASGSIRLTAGVHRLLVRYFQADGPLELQLAWAREGEPPAPLPAWALAPRQMSASRMIAILAVRLAWRAAVWLWLGAIVFSLTAAIWRRLRQAVSSGEPGAVAEWMLIITGMLLLFFVLPHEIQSDGMVRLLALSQLVEWHEVSAVPYSLVGPLFSLPLYLLGKVVASSGWWCARFNVIVFGGGLAVLCRILSKEFDARTLRRFALILIGASMFPYHLEGYFAEVFTAVLVAVGLAAVRFGHPVGGWAAAIVGVVNTPASIVGLGLAGLLETWENRRFRHLVPVLIAATLIGAESWIRRASPFASGYAGNHGETTILTYSGRPGFSYPLFFGLLSILFSFGKGLVFYAPGLLLPIRSGCHRIWLAFIVGLVLVYAKWWAWFGGLFWGPRFFLFACLPASLALAVWLNHVRERTIPMLCALLAAVALSTWVAVNGVAFDLSALEACRTAEYEWLCLYVPEFSPLWRPFVQFTRPSADRMVIAGYFVVSGLWLTAPVAVEISRRGRTVALAFARSFAGGGAWRV